MLLNFRIQDFMNGYRYKCTHTNIGIFSLNYIVKFVCIRTSSIGYVLLFTTNLDLSVANSMKFARERLVRTSMRKALMMGRLSSMMRGAGCPGSVKSEYFHHWL